MLKKGFFDAPRRPPSASGRAPPLEEIKPKAGSAAGGGRKGLGSAGPAIPDFLRVEPEKRAGAIKDHIIVRAAPRTLPRGRCPCLLRAARRGTPATVREPAPVGRGCESGCDEADARHARRHSGEPGAHGRLRRPGGAQRTAQGLG